LEANRQTHLRHLEAFFNALATNGLAINLEKCVFTAPSLEILGHINSATGVAPTADHAAKIKNCPPPQDIKQLQCFLGMVNFYRHFLPKCAQVMKPLTDLLKGGAKTLWTDPTQEAFQNAKRLLAAAMPLQYPAPNAELSLATDASNTHIGGVMQQKSRDHWRSLGFFSHKHIDTESHYSPFAHELLAAQAAIKHFRHFCEGCVFSTLDQPQTSCYHPVTCFCTNLAKTTAPFGIYFRVQCTTFVSPSLKNVIADCLSRPPPTRWISRHLIGSRSSECRRDCRRAKMLCRNATFARQHIPQIGFPPDRRSTPGW
jgi:hypothetical protein